ncbi:uncharacterized protein LOC131574002 [Poecile atricapillus]|uniref:uncharacterized protein LOC131574002 n=1 Tax=Poecile atricapillus TaxID=48891 RepID=UPI00273A3AE3|nr:uncharacterized protein LOC131574002 [Poecile atricapillus]
MAAPRVSLGPLKEPLGLNRALQWFFSIFAFSTCGGFEGSVTFSITCGEHLGQVTQEHLGQVTQEHLGQVNQTAMMMMMMTTTVSAKFGYPFRLNQAVFLPSLTHLCNHTWPQDVHLIGDFSSAARFFVGVAVVAFLYSLLALGGYLGYLHLYRCAGSRLPSLVSDAGVGFTCTGVSRCVQVCPGVLRCLQVSPGVSRCVQVGSESLDRWDLPVQVCPGVSRWDLRAWTGVTRCAQVSPGVSRWGLRACPGGIYLSRCVQVCPGGI